MALWPVQGIFHQLLCPHEILNLLSHKGWSYTIYSSPGGPWLITIQRIPVVDGCLMLMDRVKLYAESRESLAHAICLVALKAVGE